MNRMIEAILTLEARAREHATEESSPAEHVAAAELIQRQSGLDPAEVVEAAHFYVREEHGTVRPVPTRRQAEAQCAAAFVLGAQAAAAMLSGGDATGHVHVFDDVDGEWSWYVTAPNGHCVASGSVHKRREHALQSFRAAQAALRNPLIDAGD